MKWKICLLYIALLLVLLLSGGDGYRLQGYKILSRSSATFSRKENDQRKIITTNTLRPELQQFLTPIQRSFVAGSAIHGTLFTLLKFTSQRFLTNAGLLHAVALGIGLWTFLGWKGWSICISYLILGSLVTKIKIAEKEKLGIAEKRHGARGPENLWGSAATAMVSALSTYIFPKYDHLFRVAYVASLATKLSDTFSSELGKAYGRTTYLITTLKLVPKGTEGAVSLEGTLAGILGSIFISLFAFSLGVLSRPSEVVISLVAAFIATTIESYIGAAVQSKTSWLNNELVNLIMTVIGAVTAVALHVHFIK